MALQRKTVFLPVAKGLNQKVSDIHLPPGELTTLENAVFDKAGEIKKRKGFDSTTLSVDKGNVDFSWSFKDSAYFIYRKGYIYRLGTVSTPGTLGAYRELGLCDNFSSEVYSVSAAPAEHHQEAPYIATSDNYICIVHLDVDYDYTNRVKNYSYRCTLLDIDGLSVVATSTGRTADALARYVYRGKVKVACTDDDGDTQSFAVYYEYNNGGNYELKRDELTITDSAVALPAFGGAGVTIAGSTNDYNQTVAQQWFDVCETTTPTLGGASVHVKICYYKNNGGTHTLERGTDNNVQSNTSSASLTLASLSGGLGATAPSTRCVIDYQGNTAYRSGTTVYYNTDTFTNSSTYFQPHGFFPHTPNYSASAEYGLFYEHGTSADHTIQAVYYDLGASPTNKSIGRGRASVQAFAGIGNAAVSGGSNAHTSNTELSTVTFHSETNGEGNTISGRSLVQQFRPEYSPFGPCRFRFGGHGSIHSNAYYSAIPAVTNFNTFPTSASAVESVPNSVIKLVKIKAKRYEFGVRNASIGNNVFFTLGGAIWRDDGGGGVVFLGLPKPSITSAAGNASAGNMTTSKTYKYKIIYEREDIHGNLYRSEPSDSISVGTASNNSVLVTFEQAGMAVKSDDYSVAIYRTVADGSNYNKVATVSGQATNEGGTSTFLDTFADSVSSAGASLYTDGDELADVIPQSCFYLEAHRNRLFTITEDHRVMYSKEFKKGFGLAFSDLFSIPLDGLEDDKPTALASAGGDLYIFRENSIWMVSGDGPTNTGGGSYFTPRLVSNSVGARKGSPTLFADSGLYFQSPKGLFRLVQGKLEYIGAAVEDHITGGTPTDVLIDIVEDQSSETIRFCFYGLNTLVFNTFNQQWGVHTYQSVGMYSVDNVVYMATSDKKLHSENSGADYKDDGVFVSMKLKTGWISLNDVQGFGRAYKFALLGEFTEQDDFTAKVKVYYDYHDVTNVDSTGVANVGPVVDTFTLSASDSIKGMKFQFRGHFGKQKCQAVRFEIYDEDNSSSEGAGFTLSAIAIEYGSKKGIFRMSQNSGEFKQNSPTAVSFIDALTGTADAEVYIGNLTRTISGS